MCSNFLICAHLSLRGLFIIDDKGNLRQITINDLPVGRSVDETLRLVQAFQFTDKHGEGKIIMYHIILADVLFIYAESLKAVNNHQIKKHRCIKQ